MLRTFRDSLLSFCRVSAYYSLVRPISGEHVIRTLEYSLPDALRDHVDMVQPTTFFGLRAMRSTISSVVPFDENSLTAELPEAVTGCTGSTITPKCLSNLYNFASATATQTAGTMGIAGFLAQHPSKFSSLCRLLSSNMTNSQHKLCALLFVVRYGHASS